LGIHNHKPFSVTLTLSFPLHLSRILSCRFHRSFTTPSHNPIHNRWWQVYHQPWDWLTLALRLFLDSFHYRLVCKHIFGMLPLPSNYFHLIWTPSVPFSLQFHFDFGFRWMQSNIIHGIIIVYCLPFFPSKGVETCP